MCESVDCCLPCREVSHLTPKLQRASNGSPPPMEHSKLHTKAAKGVSFPKELSYPKEVSFPSVPVYIPHSRSMPMEGKSSDPEEDTSGVGTLGTNTLSSTMRSGDSNESARRRESPSSNERRPRADSITAYLYGPDYGSKSQPDLSRALEFEFRDGVSPGVEGREGDTADSKVGSKAGGKVHTGSNSTHSTSTATPVTSAGGLVSSKPSVQSTPAEELSPGSCSELQDGTTAQDLLDGAPHPGVVVPDEYGGTSVEVIEVVANGIDDSGELHQEREELQLLQDQLEQQMKQLQNLEGQVKQKLAGTKGGKVGAEQV